MKKSCWLLILLSISCLLVHNSFALTITDQTDNLYTAWYDGNNKLNYAVDSNGKYTLVDHIGDGFDTEKIEISNSSTGIEFKIVTSFDGFENLGGTEVEIADFFLNFGSLGSFGVDLSWDGRAKNDGFFSAGLYRLADDDYITSQMVFSQSEDTDFGGAYVDRNGDLEIPNVDFEQNPASKIGDITDFTRSANNTDFIYSFSVDFLAIAGLNSNSSFDFLFATAECGNDVITGTVPEPATMMLFGLGLLGISAIGRKRD